MKLPSAYAACHFEYPKWVMRWSKAEVTTLIQFHLVKEFVKLKLKAQKK